MTRFEEELKAAIGTEFDHKAKAAAEVAKRYIEKAFNDAKQMEPYLSTAERYPNLNEWLKENGIV